MARQRTWEVSTGHNMREQSYSLSHQPTITTTPLPPGFDTPDAAVAAYNKRAKELGKPLTVLDSKITATLVKESASASASATQALRVSKLAPPNGYTGIRVTRNGKFEVVIWADGTKDNLGSE